MASNPVENWARDELVARVLELDSAIEEHNLKVLEDCRSSCPHRDQNEFSIRTVHGDSLKSPCSMRCSWRRWLIRNVEMLHPERGS